MRCCLTGIASALYTILPLVNAPSPRKIAHEKKYQKSALTYHHILSPTPSHSPVEVTLFGEAGVTPCLVAKVRTFIVAVAVKVGKERGERREEKFDQ